MDVVETGSQKLPHDDNVPADKLKVFVSYSRKDIEFVGWLVDALSAQDDIHVFRDTDDILPTEEWRRRLGSLIGQADTIVFCLSRHSSVSEVCAWEVEFAENMKKRIAPIVIENVDGRVPEGLAKRNYIFFIEQSQFELSLEGLLAALRTDIAWIREHTRIGELARNWERRGRRDDQRLRGIALSEAEAWLRLRPHNAPELDEITLAFIAASRKREDVDSRRQRRAHASFMGLLLSIIIGLIGWINQDYLKERWHWYAIALPYIRGNIQSNLLSTEREASLSAGQTFQECSRVCPELVVIPAGKFQMGSAEGPKRERPQHPVSIARFAVSKFEITHEQWDECVKLGSCTAVSKDFGGGNMPVIKVSWLEAKRYVMWWSKFTGKDYRLLSESEWEYIARAGSNALYSIGDDATQLCRYGNVRDKAGQRLYPQWTTIIDCEDNYGTTAPVGSYKPNAFGLYDLHGNVWEWVEDCWNDGYDGAPADGSAWTTGDCSFHPLRGGSWDNIAPALRTTNRYRGLAGSWAVTVGFRLARTLSTTSSE